MANQRQVFPASDQHIIDEANRDYGKFLIRYSSIADKFLEEFKEEQTSLLEKKLVTNPNPATVRAALNDLNKSLDELELRIASNKSSIEELDNMFLSIGQNQLETMKCYLPTSMHVQYVLKIITVGSVVKTYKPEKFTHKLHEQMHNHTIGHIEGLVQMIKQMKDFMEEKHSKPDGDLLYLFVEAKQRMRDMQNRLNSLEDEKNKSNPPIRAASVTKKLDDSPSLNSVNPSSPSSDEVGRVSQLTLINNKTKDIKGKLNQQPNAGACGNNKCVIM